MSQHVSSPLSSATARSGTDGGSCADRAPTGLRIGQLLSDVERLVGAGGPTPDEYAAFGRWIARVAAETRAGRLSEGELRALRAAFGRALSLETNQGLSLRKPHGYPGDYEIIDRMYREHVTDDPTLQNWDRYFHAQDGPIAVRHRKAYFLDLARAIARETPADRPVPILDVASGPARDVAELLSDAPDPRLTIECVDADADAIAYARGVCGPFLDRVTFKHANALRYTSDRRFRLVWSAGLFDYFGDKGFQFLLERLLGLLTDDGELVIGNFSPRNRSRDYMEVVGDWPLFHRTEADLVRLAVACGVPPDDIRIGQEPCGVNLFLHVKRGARFAAMNAGA
ncbi:methyltransferase domain-containing protein [Rubrivirga sp. IMCC43871]|uniref:methyltransferase domain-containing protein n=1 Tax=Rubrivirga sp. IMCC43871 TaxID=3391575 RepID=UPI00398FD85D